MDRDVHYTLGHDGSFLRNEASTFAQLKARSDIALKDPYMRPFDRDREAKALRDLVTVRSQMLGKPVDQLVGKEQYGEMGVSAETALTAPPGAYLMMGDNSPQSWDSRCWGYVASENLRGRVLAVVLPVVKLRFVPEGLVSFRLPPNSVTAVAAVPAPKAPALEVAATVPPATVSVPVKVLAWFKVNVPVPL